MLSTMNAGMSSAAETLPKATGGVKFTDIHFTPHGQLPKRRRRYDLRLRVGKDFEETASVLVKGPNAKVSWNDLIFDYVPHGSFGLRVDVYQHSALKSTQIFGTAANITPKALPDTCKLQGAEGGEGQITFTIASFATYTEVLDTLKEAGSRAKDVDSMEPAPSVLMPAWDHLVDTIHMFAEFVNKISEIHPYVRTAWSVLRGVYKIFVAQKIRDDNINRLAEKITDVYNIFILSEEPLMKIESQMSIAISLAAETLECSYFIRDYARNKRFWKRLLANLVADADRKIKQYQLRFDTYKLRFQEQAAIVTECGALRLQSGVGDLAREFVLQDMPYAPGARFNIDKRCLQDTRGEVIAEISNWVMQDDEDPTRIYFLHDVAGAGKSAVAHEVAQRFDSLDRLGSSYFFDRAHQAERSPANVFSTIARDLADHNHEWKVSLLEAVGDRRARRATHVPREQFEKLILDPSRGLESLGTTLVVIDALDESGDQEARKGLLSVLGNEAAKLPRDIRVLITSRPEQDIQDALIGKKHVLSRSFKEIDPNPAVDISRFVKAELGHLAALEHKWPNYGWCQLLVDKSEGHFQWASAACRFVQGDGKHGQDPVKQLERVLARSLSPC